MFEIDLIYSTFKDIIANKQLLCQYYTEGKQYKIFAIDGPLKYNTSIWTDTSGIQGIDAAQELINKTDFETNYMPDANKSLEITASGSTSNFIGKQIEIPDTQEAEGFCEWSFDTTVFLNKVLPVTISAEWGDYINFQILLKEGDTLVKQYGTNVYVYQDQPSYLWFQGIGAGEIPNFCKVRCVYHKVGTNPRKFIAIAEFLV